MGMHPFDMFRGLIKTLMGSGRRNLYAVFDYKPIVTFEHRLGKYLRQDIAARVVDAPALAMWTNPPVVTSTDESWNTAWQDLVDRGLWSAFEKADKLAGIGRYSVILIGFNDGAQSLETPVNTRSISQKQSDAILYFQPYMEITAKIVALNQDPSNPRFMQPELYEISPMKDLPSFLDNGVSGLGAGGLGFFGDKGQPNTFRSFRVHASRILHVAENTLENKVFGSPRMERVYNILDDLLKVSGGAAETFWLIGNRGLHIDIDKDTELDKEDAKKLKNEVDEYMSELRRVIRTRGVKVNELGSDTPDPSGIFNMLIAILSGATGIPRRILTGSEAGNLASEQDRANWADRIKERRASFGNPHMLIPFIKTMTAAGYLPTVKSMTLTIKWPNAFNLSPLEFAQSSAQHARSAANFAKMFDVMENLKRGTPGTPDSVGPDGEKIPGTPEVPGADLGELVSIEEARVFMGLEIPEVTFDSGSDISSKAPKT
jgi:hypothetical protein